jgi:hypothetical protein
VNKADSDFWLPIALSEFNDRTNHALIAFIATKRDVAIVLISAVEDDDA